MLTSICAIGNRKITSSSAAKVCLKLRSVLAVELTRNAKIQHKMHSQTRRLANAMRLILLVTGTGCHFVSETAAKLTRANVVLAILLLTSVFVLYVDS